MNDGQKSVVLNYETVAVTNTRDRDFVFHPNDRSRALSIIRGLWNVEAMQAIVIEGEEALLRLRDLLLAMVPLGYEALVEAEKAEAGNRLVKEMQGLAELIRLFSDVMRKRLFQKAVERGDWVDVANLASMLWFADNREAVES